jgi:aminoglycoside 3-N-acetyltransferase I
MCVGHQAKVKRLGPGDEVVAQNVIRHFKGHLATVDYLRNFLAQSSNYVMVALVDTNVVGFLLAYELPRLDGQVPMLFVYEIEVDSDYRRRGIGSSLIAKAIDIVKQNKWTKAFVFTNRANSPADALYQKTGGRMVNGDDHLFVYDGHLG